MKKNLFVLIISIIILTGCGPNTEVADLVVKNLNDDDEISYYITESFQLEQHTSAQYSGYKYINFDLSTEANSNFMILSNSEKNDVFLEIINIIEETTDYGFKFECGDKKICAFNNIKLKNGEDTYSYESVDMSSDLVMNHNGKKIYPLEQETVNTTSYDSNITLDKVAIHEFMDQKYNEITNYGENYEPEIHDPMVAKLASEQFNISEEEANQIFIEVEMQQQ